MIQISFGKPGSWTRVERVEKWDWQKAASFFTSTPPISESKEAKGWFSTATFTNNYRDADNLQSRTAILWDQDAGSDFARDTILAALRKANIQFAAYATHSDGPDFWDAKSQVLRGKRTRFVIPTDREMTGAEYECTSRVLAEQLSVLPLLAKESHVPAQMMFMPLRKPGAAFWSDSGGKVPVYVDATLADLPDWTDAASWPAVPGEKVADPNAERIDPREIPGIVGAFCRVYDIHDAIREFELPYDATANPERYTYTAGSRPEGAVIYDDGLKLQSHHDTDPAHGQVNSFDLVRLHKFGGDREALVRALEHDARVMGETGRCETGFESLPALALPELGRDGGMAGSAGVESVESAFARMAAANGGADAPRTLGSRPVVLGSGPSVSPGDAAPAGSGQPNSGRSASSAGASTEPDDRVSHSRDSVQSERLLGISVRDTGSASVTPPDSRNPFRVETAAEYLNTAPQSWIVKHVIPAAPITTIIGPSGSGKTFIALDIVAAINRGAPWRGKRTKKQKTVLLAAEDAGGARLRLKAYLLDKGVAEADMPAMVDASPDLREPEQVAALAHSLKQYSPEGGVVLIDTLAASMPGADENSSKDMGLVLSNLKAIYKLTGFTVILIHHTGKDADKGARGWSGLKGNVDAELTVTRDEKDNRSLDCTKQKNAHDGAQFGFRLKVVPVGTDEDGEDITSCVCEETTNEPAKQAQATAAATVERFSGIKLPPAEAVVMRAIEMNGEMPIGDLIAAYAITDLSADRSKVTDTARRVITKLVQRGLVFQNGNVVRSATYNSS